MQATIIGITSDGINNDILDIECLGASNFKIGQRVDVYHLTEGVTDKQRGLMFALIGYSIEIGMKDLGHFSVNGIWEDIKQWVRDNHAADYGKDFGMRTMKKLDVDMFVKFVMDEYFVALCNIDVSGFWDEYDNFKIYEARMNEQGIEVTFRDYWKAKGEK